MAVREILERLSRVWSTPRPAIHHGRATAFELCCTVRAALATHDSSESAPASLVELWETTSGATLFEDADFGQWGLELLSAEASALATESFREARHRDWLVGDRVVGRFLGDQELLVVRSDSAASDFGAVLVALPLDVRSGWYRADGDLEGFLMAYEDHQGAKFWEWE